MKQIAILLILTVILIPVSGQILDGGNGHAIIVDRQGNVWTIGRNNYGQILEMALLTTPPSPKW